MGVVCYYTFSVKGFQENYAMFTPNCRSLQESEEEKIFGRIPSEKIGELNNLIKGTKDLGRNLSHFLKDNHLLFAATDRSVLNLPAIGKSMTFVMAGITPDGKRILKFEHDATRRHSPIIDHMDQVYIVENKSVAAYLRQLQSMGEDPEAYKSIWYYTDGKTEPRFPLFEYPEFSYKATATVTNLQLE